MAMTEPVHLDHLFLDAKSRSLIVKACAGAKIVYLSPLEKGLSGSSVWLARWAFKSDQLSKYHVFKIGPLLKLRQEREAAQSIASVFMRHFSHIELFEEDSVNIALEDRLALLRQEFMGDVEGRAVNLKRFIELSRKEFIAEQVLRKLYEETMAAWHPIPTPSASIHESMITQPFSETLDWWLSRMNLAAAADEIGSSALEKQLEIRFNLTLRNVEEIVNRLVATQEQIRVGPVHGDLHAENVLIDEAKNINVIDYGWTALDK